MTSTNLAAKAAALGLKPEDSEDANRTLAEIAASREGGFWEAFPLLLANAAAAGRFEYSAAENRLPEGEKKLLKPLIFLSLGLYASLKLNAPWKSRLSAGMPERMTENFRQKIEAGDPFEISGVTVDPGRLREVFEAGRGSAPGDGLESALLTIFTPRQRDLLVKKIRRAPLTKTEREYYSRVIRKKVVALANGELHALARRALE